MFENFQNKMLQSRVGEIPDSLKALIIKKTRHYGVTYKDYQKA